MNCYDCHRLGRTTPALAMCRRCGAAVCAEHLTVHPEEIQRVDGVGRTTSSQPARRFTCAVCHVAEHRM